MKKLNLILFIFLFGAVSAQTHFGAKAGYISSTLKWGASNDTFWEDYSDFDSKSYFYVGGFAEHFLSEKFAIQGELIYTEIGGKTYLDLYQIVGTEVVNTGKTEVKYNYPQLQIPISAKYYFIKNLAVSGGLNFGFNLNPNVEFNFVGMEDGKIENAKTLNLFPFLGAEYHFTNNIFADARYNFGTGNIHESGVKVNANFFQIGLGYRFN